MGCMHLKLASALKNLYAELVAQAAAGKQLTSDAEWLVDNYAFVQTQVREVCEALPRAYWTRLPMEDGMPRVHKIAREVAELAGTDFSGARVQKLLQNDERIAGLSLAELWALGPMLKLVLVEAITPETARRPIAALRAFEAVRWRELVEEISPIEQTLRTDPAGIYVRMNFRTRDDCRHAVERVARNSRRNEQQVAALAVELAGAAQRSVAYFLIGEGVKKLQERARYRSSVRERTVGAVRRFPNFFYMGGLVLLTTATLWPVRELPWWILAILVIPASQAALTVLNRLVNIVIPPRILPRMDFDEGIPGDCRTFVVVPTLLLSRAEVSKLLERLEIHYLANRDPNLYFALLTDFPDSSSPQGDGRTLDAAIRGIELLNHRYGNGHGPFYLFHRDSVWNESEGVWMGHERKRGKLNDFNALLRGRSDAFAVKVGDLSVLPSIRYVVTLDGDTQLPLDTARELIATMAHPLNRPVMDPVRATVRSGYAILQPRISISMESAGRSRLAAIYSGQTGFDPYTTAVSDVYQDLYGRASFTGKGIYDVCAFEAAAGERFPENTLLSHDLLEGEHARVGLVTDLEFIDDYPSTYESYSKRKHRWVRGDWQIGGWLLGGRKSGNPLSLLSRWKIVDNLRRSLLEIALLAVLLTGQAPFYAIALVLFPGYVELLFALLRLPPPRFWPSYLREAAYQFGRAHLDALLQLAFLPHQACLMADAIVRTLVRRHITRRRLLEWQTMAQSEATASRGFDLTRLYLYLCPLLAIPLALLCRAPILLLELWIASPLVAMWLNGRNSRPQPVAEGSDPDFLRTIALRTWRYFTDFAGPESNWLAPDNVQEDPPARAHRASPTNLGLQLAVHVTAHDFGYVTHQELAMQLYQTLAAIGRLERKHGHFYNWYDTQSLQPLPPLYISTVDSGNMAVALVALKQGCLAMPDCPLIDGSTLAGLRDHCLLLRDSLPSDARVGVVMKLLESLLQQCDSEPTDLFYWESVLTDVRETVGRLREPVSRMCGDSEETCYWLDAISARVDIVLNDLYALAPWLAPPLETELRIGSVGLAGIVAELAKVPKLGALPTHYEKLADAIRRRLQEERRLPEPTREALELLLQELPSAAANAGRLLDDFQREAATLARWIDEMDFSFLFDKRRKLLHIGYDAGAEAIDPAYYDLLASEARAAVFMAIARRDIPREAWFRLNRRLTSYRGRRALVSWSGTMFEYLMPALFMKTYPQTLIAQSAEAAVAIQRQFAGERGVPWGISEAACHQRDHELNYQYRAFGIHGLAANSKLAEGLVVAPYASMLATMVDCAAAAENLRRMAAMGWTARYGFYESVDYSGGKYAPEVIRAHMVHHQGMGFIALANTLLDGVMSERFHADPMVQATEFLLQERVPALVNITPELQVDQKPRPESIPGAAQLPSPESVTP
jgi:hypothetical protein